MQSRAATAPAGGRAAGRQFLKSAEPSIFSSRHSPGVMTHADPVGSVDGSSSAVGFGVLEREREDGAADSVTVTVGVGDADVIPAPGSPPVRSAARATINPPMPARAPTISQWMWSRQDFRAFWAGREGPFDPGAEEPIEFTSDLLLMKDPRREQEKQSLMADFSTPRHRSLPPTCRGSFAGDGGSRCSSGRVSVRARPLVRPAARPAEPRPGRSLRRGRLGRGGPRGTVLRPAGAGRARRRRCSTRTCPRGGP